MIQDFSKDFIPFDSIVITYYLYVLDFLSSWFLDCCIYTSLYCFNRRGDRYLRTILYNSYKLYISIIPYFIWNTLRYER